MRHFYTGIILLFFILCWMRVQAQISPGELASVHSHLEGISNCTKCHEPGAKVTNAKCLACHSDLKARIDQQKGYHSATGVKGKYCTGCHSDHHGLNFRIIRFDQDKFNHNLTGFQLTGAHRKQPCNECHKKELISLAALRSKKYTYMGLPVECAGCHKDYHQQTLSSVCGNCHGTDSFKPATKFNHASTRFLLAGKHQVTDCVKCHPLTNRNGKPFQEFAGVKSKNCNNCHQDIHQNKFGQNCRKCHTEESFHSIKPLSEFDHSKTSFALENKHLDVPCENCHKGNVTTPLKHDHCTDCHKDFHEGQFITNNKVTDCSVCHTTEGYELTLYTVEKHALGKFPLKGAHLASPCLNCHKKTDNWKFRNIGINCVDCHKDVHLGHLDPKYYPASDCSRCHSPSSWNGVAFDHSETTFPLLGSHLKQTCRECHYKPDSSGKPALKFTDLPVICISCHQDIHFSQFDEDGLTNCAKCHTFERWSIPGFDHNATAFSLTGQHQNVACFKCHKKVTEGQNTFVMYKIKAFRCENCH